MLEPEDERHPGSVLTAHLVMAEDTDGEIPCDFCGHTGSPVVGILVLDRNGVPDSRTDYVLCHPCLLRLVEVGGAVGGYVKQRRYYRITRVMPKQIQVEGID